MSGVRCKVKKISGLVGAWLSKVVAQLGFVRYRPLMSDHADNYRYEYYICKRCGHRIHQSLVPPSLSGDVICCGRPMSRPGRPPSIVFWTGLIWIVGGTFILYHYFGWMIWTAILLTIAVTIVVRWLVGKTKKN